MWRFIQSAGLILSVGSGVAKADDAGARPMRNGACVAASTRDVWKKTPGRVFDLRMAANETGASLTWGVMFSAHSNPPEARLVANLPVPLAGVLDARVAVKLPFGWPPWLTAFAVPVRFGGDFALVRWNPVFGKAPPGRLCEPLFIVLERDKKARLKAEVWDSVHSETIGEVTLSALHAVGDSDGAFVVATARDGTAATVSDDKNKQPDFSLWAAVFGKAAAAPRLRKIARGRGLAIVLAQDGPVLAFDDVGRRKLARLGPTGEIAGAAVELTRARAENVSMAARGDEVAVVWDEPRQGKKDRGRRLLRWAVWRAREKTLEARDLFLPSGGVSAEQPSIAVAGDRYVVSWIEREKKKAGRLKVAFIKNDAVPAAAGAATVSGATQDVRVAVVSAAAGQAIVAWSSREKRREQIRVSALTCDSDTK